MEPAGAVRHRRSREAVSAWQCANQSNLHAESPQSSPTFRRVGQCPRREWKPRVRLDIDLAQRASARIMRESIEPRCRTTTKFTHSKGALHCVTGGNTAGGSRDVQT